MIHSIYLSVKIVRYTLKNNHEKTNLSSNLSFYFDRNICPNERLGAIRQYVAGY